MTGQKIVILEEKLKFLMSIFPLKKGIFLQMGQKDGNFCFDQC